MTEKTKELTTLEAAFLEYLFHPDVKGNIRQAMKLAGYSENMAPGVIIKQLRAEIVERALTEMAAHSAQAFFAMLGVLDTPSAVGAKTKLEAARQILDRAGVTK